VGERVWSTRLLNVSSSTRARVCSSATPWWDVKARLDEVLRRDDRSEFGYLDHESVGEVVFEKTSEFNGKVRVVAHGPWRSLRFNEVEQGLTYVTVNEATKKVTADVDVLGYEYLRCMTAAGAALCRLDGETDWIASRQSEADSDGKASPKKRVICVGLGSGAMPAFIAKKFPDVFVEVVEIDPVVVEATSFFHGLRLTSGDPGAPPDRASRDRVRGDLSNLTLVLDDAAAFMESAAAAVARGDAVGASAIFLDAFDGAGETPRGVSSDAFLRACRSALSPGGVVVSNCFNGVEGSAARFAAETFAAALAKEIGPVTSWTVETPVNVVFAAKKRRLVSENLGGGVWKPEPERFTRRELRDAASRMSDALRFEWDAGERIRKAFWVEIEDSVEVIQNAGPPDVFPRVIRERPAGLDVDPFGAFARRLGTTMPDEWDEDHEEVG